MPSYGRVAVAEPPSSLAKLHFHDGVTPLKAVVHEPLTPVLDQEDLTAQGIDVAALVPGAQAVDALGSCVANASVSALAALLPLSRLAELGVAANTVADEEYAIRLYHSLTMLTGSPSQEWPPDDCGSSGLYACEYLQQQGLIAGSRIASGAQNICSLLQTGGLITGQPFFYSWEEPDASGFIDGDGSMAALQAAIASGVAGGHETYWAGIEHIAFLPSGQVDPLNTVIRFRNSWGTSWGLQGEARAHLSTYAWLGSHCDFRQFTA